jgi:hypothetical protein
MNIENKIKRHGYHLMSLASLGMLCVGVVGLCLILMPYLPDWKPESGAWLRISGLEWDQVIRLNGTGKALVSASNFIWTLAYLLPLLALRRLGSKLYKHDALTLQVAHAFLWLAHALLSNALLLMLAGFLIAMAEEAGGVHIYRSNFDISGGYIWLIACLCLYSVAHIMRLAAQASDDARSIV